MFNNIVDTVSSPKVRHVGREAIVSKVIGHGPPTHDVRLGLRDRQVALCGATVPQVVVQLALLGLWSWFSFKKPNQTLSSKLLLHLAGRCFCWPQPGSDAHAVGFRIVGFDPAKFVAAAALIRGHLGVVGNSGGDAVALGQRMRDDIIFWLNPMSPQHFGELMRLLKVDGGANAGFGCNTDGFLFCLRVVDCLGSWSRLRKPVQLAGRIIGLPSGRVSAASDVHIATALCRHGFIVDCALTLVFRISVHSLKDANARVIIKTFFDGSPRMGKALIFSAFDLRPVPDAVEFGRARNELSVVRESGPDSIDAIRVLSGNISNSIFDMRTYHWRLVPDIQGC